MFESLDLVWAIRRLSLAFLPLALGIIVHEVAHGWMAARRGDLTATMEGRITLNPVKHVDPAGLFVFVFTSLFAPFAFGWAKPVPVDYRNLRNPLKDMMLISAAGPLSNFLVAIGFALALHAFLILFPGQDWRGSGVWLFFRAMLEMGVGINCTLAWLNLIPLPPMDGSKIVMGFLPRHWVLPYMRLERYGTVILILLLVSGFLGKILFPLALMSRDFIFLITGLI